MRSRFILVIFLSAAVTLAGAQAVGMSASVRREFSLFPLKNPVGQGELTDSQIAKLTEEEARDYLSKSLGQTYDRLSLADSRWIIAWYETDLDKDEAREQYQNLQAAFVKELSDGARWTMLAKVAKRAGVPESDLAPLIAAHQELQSLAKQRLELQLKWVDTDDETVADAIGDNIYKIDEKIVDQFYIIVPDEAEWIDLESFWSDISDFTKTSALFWRFSIVVNPDLVEAVTVGTAYDGADLKAGDVIIGIGEDEEDAPFAPVTSLRDVSGVMMKESAESKRYKFCVRRGEEELTVHQKNDEPSTGSMLPSYRASACCRSW